MGALEIRCKNGCSESVAAVVGALEGGGFVLEGGEGYDWAEDFFAVWKRGGFLAISFFFLFLFGLYGGEKEDREGRKKNLQIFMSSRTLVKTVGAMKNPLPPPPFPPFSCCKEVPPIATVAPSSIPDLIYSKIRSYCTFDTCGP